MKRSGGMNPTFTSNTASAAAGKKRSLLGYDNADEEALLKTTQEQLKAQNDAKIEQLLEGTGLLKKEVEGIDVELGLSKAQLDTLNRLMSDTRGGLSNVMDRLKHVTATASSKHVLLLVLFVVGILFFLFYFLRK